MTVLDAYAALAFLKLEPAADDVEVLLEGGAPAQLTAVGLAEVVDHLVRLVGAAPDDVVLDLAQLGLLDALDVDDRLGRTAGLLRATHYDRRRRAVSLADCIAAAAAQQHERPLATADPDLLDLCHDEAIPTVVLPASDGSVWTPTVSATSREP